MNQWGSEEDMPIRPVFEQIGERFGRFDSAVRTSFPLPSYLIFTLTPTPVDPVLSMHHPMHPHTLTRPYMFVVYISLLPKRYGGDLGDC